MTLRSPARLRLAVALALSWHTVSVFACGGPFSRCVSLETLLPTNSASRFLSLHVPPATPTDSELRIAWQTNFHERPLVLVLASPDPTGRELPIVERWTSHFLTIDGRLGRALRGGVHIPAGLRLAGTGFEAITSQSRSPGSDFGVGDPILFSQFRLPVAPLQLSVVQRLALPLGTTASWQSHASVEYSPGVAASRSFGPVALGAEWGARLSSRERVGDVEFGPALYMALGIAYRIHPAVDLTLEGWALPALTRSELRTERGELLLTRRVPSEWLLSAHWLHHDERIALGIGSSVPLGSRQQDGQHEVLNGPPGPLVRIALRLEQDLP